MNLNIPSLVFKKITEADSEINGKIFVFQEGSRVRLSVDNSNYSIFTRDKDDFFLDRYWGKLVYGISGKRKSIRRVLILGLGGGTFVYLLNHYFKPEIIEGIEIDPDIINLGKEYFYLSKYKNLLIHQADAISWAREKKESKKQFFDLVVLDIYKAVELPKECEEINFLKNIFEMISPNGMMAFNRACKKGCYQEVVDSFRKEKLEPFFNLVEVDKMRGVLGFDNYLIYAQSPKKGD